MKSKAQGVSDLPGLDLIRIGRYWTRTSDPYRVKIVL